LGQAGVAGCKWFQRQAGQDRPGADAESATVVHALAVISSRFEPTAGTRTGGLPRLAKSIEQTVKVTRLTPFGLSLLK